MPAPAEAQVCLIIATRNLHKADEIRAILSRHFQYRTLNDLPGAPPVVEDAATFAGNATKKAVTLAEWLAKSAAGAATGVPSFVLADDSGLEVDALDGAPGVHSARFAALDGTAGAAGQGNSPDAANNAKLLRLLKDILFEKRTARFRCVLALTPVLGLEPAGSSPVGSARGAELQTQLFEGVCEGRIDFAPSGSGGFGYDPLFVPAGYRQSFAELGEEVKNQISHRSRALMKLRERVRAG